MRAAFLQDGEPRFPQPMTILAQRSKIIPLQATGLVPDLPDDVQISFICESIEKLNIVIQCRLETAGDGLWGDVLFPQFHLAPILHDLLSMSRASVMDSASAHSKEFFRLAAVLYLCKLWTLFGMDMVGDARYVAKLELSWTQQDLSLIWCFERPLFLWAILVSCTCEKAPVEMRREMVHLLQEHGWQYHQPPGVVPRSLWCESALGSPDPIFQCGESST